MVTKSIVVLVLLAVAVTMVLTQCPPGGEVCPMRMEDFHNISITSDSDNLYISATGCPPYLNPRWSNPGSACSRHLTYTIPRRPKFSPTPIPVGEELSRFDDIWYLKENPRPLFGAIGILLNGVVVFGRGSPCGFGSVCPDEGTGAPSMYVDAVDSEGHTIDQCGGHPQNRGEYHIHSGATFQNDTGREMCGLPLDTPGEHSVLLGWMFDGFPMYGQFSQEGELPTALDACHGHTHEIDGVMTYHYHMPLSYPHIIGCFKGCVEASNNQRQLGGLVSQYCPDGGLDSDPQPLYEGVGPTDGISPTDRDGFSTAVGFAASVLAVALNTLLSVFLLQ